MKIYASKNSNSSSNFTKSVSFFLSTYRSESERYSTKVITSVDFSRISATRVLRELNKKWGFSCDFRADNSAFDFWFLNSKIFVSVFPFFFVYFNNVSNQSCDNRY